MDVLLMDSGPNRYLIVGYSRSGTTVIHLALKGHPRVSAFNGELRPEPFFSLGISAFNGSPAGNSEVELERGHRAVFDAITALDCEDPLAIGAKTACNSAQSAQNIVDMLRGHFPDMKVIHTLRAETIAHFGSRVVSRKTGVMHSWNEGFSRERKTESVKLDRWQLVNFALQVEAVNDVFAGLAGSHDYMTVENGAYIEDADTVHKALFEFVGVPVMDVTWLNSDKVLPPAREYVSNYDECLGWLADLDDPSVRMRARSRGKLSSALGKLGLR